MQREICVVVVCVEYDRIRERWLCIVQRKRKVKREKEGFENLSLTDVFGYVHQEKRPVPEASQVYSADLPPARCKA